MSGLGRVSATDVVRSFGANIDAATPYSIKKWLEDYLNKKGGGFGYDPAIAGLSDVMQGARTFEGARLKVSQSGRPMGRPYNVAVFDALEGFAKAHKGQVHRLKNVAVKIGSHGGLDIHVGLKVPMVRVHDRVARLVIPAFRTTYLPTWEQSALECSIVMAFLAQNDFYGVENFEYLAVRSRKSALDRVCQVYTQNDLRILEIDRVNELLSSYLRAAAMLIDEGKGLKPARLAGYQIIDPRDPGLFG